MKSRVIKFRGRDIITGNWAYGYYYPSNGNHVIRDENNNECMVLKKSVGQLTGLTDKNGKEIYESDYYQRHNYLYLVVWDAPSFMAKCVGRLKSGSSDEWEKIQGDKLYVLDADPNTISVIVGNIYEHPNLLK